MSPESLETDCKITYTIGKPTSCVRIGDYLRIHSDGLGFEVIFDIKQ